MEVNSLYLYMQIVFNLTIIIIIIMISYLFCLKLNYTNKKCNFMKKKYVKIINYLKEKNTKKIK